MMSGDLSLLNEFRAAFHVAVTVAVMPVMHLEVAVEPAAKDAVLGVYLDPVEDAVVGRCGLVELPELEELELREAGFLGP